MKAPMKLLFVLALSLHSCANRVATLTAPPPPLPQPIALIGKFAAAHACPVAGWIVTASHVAYVEKLEGGRITSAGLNYIYQSADGAWGIAVPGQTNEVVDLAILELYPPYTGFSYAIGAPPEPGDEVRWVEFDFRSAKEAYGSRERVARVVTARVGHVVIYPSPEQGASGSCLFDSAGAVIGIISGGLDTHDGKVVGIAVGLDLLPIKEE